MRHERGRLHVSLIKEEFENWKSQIVTSNIYSQEEIDALKIIILVCNIINYLYFCKPKLKENYGRKQEFIFL